MLRAAIVLALCAASASGLALAAPADWLGSTTCAETCHPEALEAWRKTAHARTASPSPRCASCHTTGDRSSRAAGVSCEACHGAGGHYAKDDIMRDPALAAALGLRDAKASCVRCHREPSTRLTPFDQAAAWKKISH